MDGRRGVEKNCRWEESCPVLASREGQGRSAGSPSGTVPEPLGQGLEFLLRAQGSREERFR